MFFQEASESAKKKNQGKHSFRFSRLLYLKKNKSCLLEASSTPNKRAYLDSTTTYLQSTETNLLEIVDGSVFYILC
jgi:hypothetical protein